MNTNPYEPPQEKSNEKPEIHASAAALRVVAIVQLLSIALVGSWARGFVSVSPAQRWPSGLDYEPTSAVCNSFC